MTTRHAALTPDAERIILGDGRKAQIRRIGPDLVVTYGRGPDAELFRTSATADLASARRAVTEWAASLKPAPAPAAPPLTYAEALALATANEATAAGLEAEARELRAQGQEALRRALA